MPHLKFKLDLDPITDKALELYLFRKVKNVDQIKHNVISGIWKCCVIKPSLIVDPLQVAVAANKAAVSLQQDSLVTRSVYTEILYNLSMTKNISQSLNKFGIENGEDILMAFLTDSESSAEIDNILSEVVGELCKIEELKNIVDMKDLKLTYKLGDIEENIVLDVILSKISTKNFVT